MGVAGRGSVEGCGGMGDTGGYSHCPTQPMSEEQLKAFWEAIQADAGLQQKLQGVTEPDAVAAIAKEAGFSISAEEIKKVAGDRIELTDEQLEAVAGGNSHCMCCAPGAPFCACCR